MEQEAPRILFLGCGNMGRALLRGWVRAGMPRSRFRAIVRTEESVENLKKRYAVAAFIAFRPLGDWIPDIVITAVKPAQIADVLPFAVVRYGNAPLYVSIAAGVRFATLLEIAQKPVRMLRAMPNLPVAIGQGVTGLYADSGLPEGDRVRAERLFGELGLALWLEDEAHMHALTAISGSGPAFVYYLMESMISAAQTLGLPDGQVQEMVRATFSGSIAYTALTGEAPEVLRRRVTSPGGTTQAGLEVLMDKAANVPDVFARTLQAAANRSRELEGEAGAQ